MKDRKIDIEEDEAPRTSWEGGEEDQIARVKRTDVKHRQMDSEEDE
jgi:hypothetical protein